MREYLVFVVAVSVLSALGGLILYGGQNERVARAAMGVVLLCAVGIPPVKAVLAIGDADIGAIFEGMPDQSVDSALGEVAKESFAVGVERLVCEEFSLSSDEVKAHIFGLDTSTMRADRIVIVLRGRAALCDLRGIETLVEESNLGKCEVKIEAS